MLHASSPSTRYPAIVLKTTPVRESDVIVSLLGPELGRISALARGARRSQKRFMGGLDLFDCGNFEIHKSLRNHQLPTLQAFDRSESWPALRESLTAFRVACYCAEITLSLTADGDTTAENLFRPLYFTLSTLNKQPGHEHAHSLATFYNLVLLQRSGLNFMDDTAATFASGVRSSEDTFAWFGQMLETSSVIVPRNLAIIQQGFLALAKHTQNLLGHPLSSVSELL